MQFQVPQFIDTEDRIVGPLTLRQFFIMGAGFGIAAILFFMIQMWLWIIIAIFIVGAAAAFAFVKVGGRPLIKITASAMNFYWQPQKYVWQPEHPKVKPVAAGQPSSGRAFSLPRAAEKPAPSRAAVALGAALHRNWEHLQTGEKVSSEQFVQKKQQRYQIFEALTGERKAARRVDYR